jgi:hypothetical protein
MFWEKIATRFVALATDGGSPKNIKIGRLRSEPPPAIVLKNPAIRPTAKIIRMCVISME